MASGVVGEIKTIEYLWGREGEPEPGADHFGVSVEVYVGEAGGDDGAEQFEVFVCSPSRFLEACSRDWSDELVAEDLEILPGGAVAPVTGTWLMRSWSRAAFEAAVTRVIDGCSPAPDFDTLSARIARSGMLWEYDYRYDGKVNASAGLPPPPGVFAD